MRKATIGVLGFQGAIEEHVHVVREAMSKEGIRGEVVIVKKEEELEEVNGLIIPGGESTVIGSMMERTGISRFLRKAWRSIAILGTCAGLIVLAKKIRDRVLGEVQQPRVGILNAVVERNFFGRQRESFEAEIEIPLIGGTFKGVFIRAPVILEVDGEAEILCSWKGNIVGARQGKVIATSFHPELAEDTRIHALFLRKTIED
ncbi:MAG: pyridoxal 5'-phosphate synthase glutaminase subunit PdxT [Candidatus Freyarchaeota archaeon]|nr:pyridoxal 5'-phosphate synthase glutaminase subunit PdxT [Candidatus Freyrarchaeum guaymaensis]